MRAHRVLNDIAGEGVHIPGLAIHHAQRIGRITKVEAATLRGLRLKANAAKHRWRSSSATDIASSGRHASLSEAQLVEDATSVLGGQLLVANRRVEAEEQHQK